MQVGKVSFTSLQQNNTKQSALYSKENFIQMGAISDFFIGTAVAFGVLESRDKFKLIKQENIIASALPKVAQRHTIKNAGLSVLFGALYTAIDMALTTKFLPKFEKAYDKLEQM